MTRQQRFTKAGKELGISIAVVKFALSNAKYCYPLLQQISDKDALMRGSCGPRPAPKLIPGYWECVGNEWVWIDGV
jgi:hypothetical protein